MFFSRARSARCSLALAATLALAAGLFAPATAHALNTRLESIENYGGQYWHRFSINGGSTWSSWSWVPSYSEDYSTTYSFTGPMSVVSPTQGLLVAAAKTTAGALVYSTFHLSYGWDVWRQLPGTSAGGVHVCLGSGFDQKCFPWNADSFPVLSTRGPGLVELFIIATQRTFRPQPGDGQIALMHSWTDWISGRSVRWSEDWESLGTGLLKGSPAAISWGPGRTDVFVVGGGDRLYHKWFANGRWSQGWEDMGGEIHSSPTVLSWYPGHLEIFAVGPAQGLWHLWFANNNWGYWEYLGGQLGVGTSPAASTRGPGNFEVFVYSGLGQLFQRSYNNGTWTAALSSTGGSQASTVYWTPLY